MTRYDVFHKLRELTKMVRTPDGFSKFVQTGRDYEYADYGEGYLEFMVRKYHYKSEGWFVIVNLETIDDGGYVGRVSTKDEQAAEALVEDIANTIIKEMVCLPKLKDLNDLMRPYGLYITCE